MIRSATISGCGKYRYALYRMWDENRPPIVFCMLNPSTADAEQDDPTVRRCIGFAKREGHGLLVVVNLYALRATNPKRLREATDPVGPENDAAIAEACTDRRVVLAWGAHRFARTRAASVAIRIGRVAAEVLRIGPPTDDGSPRHPLYLHADLGFEACTRVPV